MKRLVFCLAFFLSFPFYSLKAQQERPPDNPDRSLYASRYGLAPRFGISLGTNYSGIKENFFGSNSKFGFYGGLKVEYFISPRWFIHSTVAYSQKGSVSPFWLINSQGNLTKEQYKDKLRLSYLDFPVLLSYQFSFNKQSVQATKIYPMVGIEQGYLIRAINKRPTLNRMDELIYNTFNLLTVDTPRYINTEIRTHRYNMGLTYGIGIEFTLKKKHTLYAEGRYAHYLTAALETTRGGKIFNKGFSINTGVFL